MVVAFVLSLLFVESAAADRILRTTGEVIEARVLLDVLPVRTPDRTLEIPKSSIRSLRFQAGAVEIRLIDGTVLTGVPLQSDVSIDRGLYSELLEWESIDSIEFEPPAEAAAAPHAPTPEEATSASTPPSEAQDVREFFRVDEVPALRVAVDVAQPLKVELDIRPEPESARKKRATLWRSGRLSRYYCDDTVISHLQLEKVTHPGDVTLVWRIFITVRRSYDRLVDLQLQLMEGDRVVAESRDRAIDAEEGKTRDLKFHMRLRPEVFEQLFSAGAAPRLRMTMTVREG